MKIYSILTWLIGVLCIGNHAIAQNNTKLDSLEKVYFRMHLNDSLKCSLLNELSLISIKSDPLKGAIFADSLMQLAFKIGSITYEAHAYYAKASNYLVVSRYPEALLLFEKAKTLYNTIHDKNGIENATNGIVKVQSSLSDFPKASEYRQKAGVLRNMISMQDSILESEYKKQEMLLSFNKKETEYRLQQQIIDEKLTQKQKDLLIAEKELALKNSQLEISEKERIIKQLAFLKEKAEKEKGEKQLSFAEKDRALKSSELAVLSKDKAIQLFEIENQKKEIAVKNLQTNYFIGGIILMLILVFFIYINYINQKKSNKIISAEKEKSENLLHNILPVEVADELKLKGHSEAKLYDNVSIIFTDFVNFTGISEKLTPKELVSEIDICFRAFDEIIEEFRLEKIKTIGDAYMAVCGLPHANEKHAQLVIKASLKICKYMQQHRQNGGKFEIRIGIHSGAVVAGIVGSKKFAYDIWGDAVNTAARLESSSEPGKINISEKTYELVKNDFNFEYRGKIKVKNKGEIDMYFIV